MTVKELAYELCTTEERVRWFGKMPKDREEISPALADYIRMRHLQKTHPWLSAKLSYIEPMDNYSYNYAYWCKAFYRKVQELLALRGQNGGQSQNDKPEEPVT